MKNRTTVRWAPLALFLLIPLLAANQQMQCTPIPVDPVCAGAGESVHPWAPDSLECCPGLQTDSWYEIGPDGECWPLDGAAVCIAPGDGVCGPGEDVCNSPDDCGAAECAAEGESVHPWDPNGLACCEGLSALAPAMVDPETGECEFAVGGAICMACGDGVCRGEENECNCPEDCAAPSDCRAEGESVFPWDPSDPGCCDGLTPLGPAEVDPVTGECDFLIGGAICMACGDGVCRGEENECNCPEDCQECVEEGGITYPSIEGQPECCAGLRAVGETEMDPDTGECIFLVGGPAMCVACGDGVCDGVEDECNCPEDCAAPAERCHADYECGASSFCAFESLDNCCLPGEFCIDIWPACEGTCQPHGCPSETMLMCNCIRPECGTGATAVIRDGCWQCVTLGSCSPVQDLPTNCG